MNSEIDLHRGVEFIPDEIGRESNDVSVREDILGQAMSEILKRVVTVINITGRSLKMTGIEIIHIQADYRDDKTLITHRNLLSRCALRVRRSVTSSGCPLLLRITLPKTYIRPDTIKIDCSPRD